jgi:DNA-directed RNA polymerase subunit M/transcription elongation factor TFIIS
MMTKTTKKTPAKDYEVFVGFGDIDDDIPVYPTCPKCGHRMSAYYSQIVSYPLDRIYEDGEIGSASKNSTDETFLYVECDKCDVRWKSTKAYLASCAKANKR